jgi:CHAD domain-containing protein
VVSVKRAAKTEHEDYATLHQVRIAGKKVRYLLEFFSPVLDGSHHPTIRKLASVQEELGDLNDLVICESLIRQYEFPPGTEILLTEVLKWLQHERRRRREALTFTYVISKPELQVRSRKHHSFTGI